MKKSLLIGDSGGTNTGWCFVDTKGERSYFSSESYHPSRFSDEFFDAMRSFWKNQDIPSDTEIHFYGAGCSLEYNQEILQHHFRSLGFEEIFIESDLLGTCRALHGNQPGFTAILGTGSVLAAYDGKQITQIYGGFGYLIGDEGSGYHFGKKLIHTYLNGGFSDKVTNYLQEKIGDRKEVLKHVYGTDGKNWISNLASAIDRNQEIVTLHAQNILEFVELYLPKTIISTKNICVSGSYAFHNRQLLTAVLLENGWNLTDCVSNPIQKMTDYTMKTAF